MTKIINIYGAPNTAKTTVALQLTSNLLQQGVSVIFIEEYPKNYFLQGRKANNFVQLYFLGKIMQSIQSALGNYDYIVLDSPPWMCAFYDEYYRKQNLLKPTLIGIDEILKEQGHQIYSFYLADIMPFQEVGRTQDLKEIQDIDCELYSFLLRNNQKPLHVIRDCDKIWFTKNLVEFIKSIEIKRK